MEESNINRGRTLAFSSASGRGEASGPGRIPKWVSCGLLDLHQTSTRSSLARAMLLPLSVRKNVAFLRDRIDTGEGQFPLDITHTGHPSPRPRCLNVERRLTNPVSKPSHDSNPNPMLLSLASWGSKASGRSIQGNGWIPYTQTGHSTTD